MKPHNSTTPRKVASPIAKGPDRLDASRFLPESRRRLGAPALRTFLAIADLWGLNEEQRRLLLGMPSRSTYHSWARIARMHGEVTLDVDVLVRLSALFGIYQALRILHATEQEGTDWLKRPHDATIFGGQPPMALLTTGTQDALLSVRRFLDAARGGLYMAPNALDAAFTPYDDSDIVFA
ncbi:MAG: MbcA/ParS/Xre antitoxin family protein [Acetobacteraceae bacterium]